MVITPNTEIRLLDVPLTLDNKNQLTFNNSFQQYNYFNNLVREILDGSSYQRKDNIIRYPDHIDNIITCNYVMYQNENYSNKWFYAFITNMRYVNDGMTEISIETDVFQTWQFDLIYKQSFIEREMINVNEDIPGSNLLPESLELGEPKVGGTAEFDELEPVNVIAYSGDTIPASPNIPVEYPITQGGFKINGISSSVVFLLVENNSDWYNILMNSLQQENFSDYIVATFTVPYLAVKDLLVAENKIPRFNAYILQNGKNYFQNATVKTLLSTPTTLDGYTPRNQKLRTYPYVYLGYNPNGGSSKIYRYEDFESGTPTFKIISEVNPNPSVFLIPQNYRGQAGDSLSDLVGLGGYPNTSNRNDFYNSWLAQNSNLISLSMQQEQYNYQAGQLQNGVSMANSMLSSLTGHPASATGIVSNTISIAQAGVNHDFYVKQQMAQIEKQQLIPDKVNLAGSNSTLLGYNLFDKNIFTRYTIKNQFARRIDKYFDMYGYLTNELKIPNINNRPNWNYVKTIGANIVGNVPELELLAIRNMFNNGITLWHNPDTFLDYSVNNR